MANLIVQDPEALLKELCRRDFSAFLRKAWPWITGGDQLQWNWHLGAISHQLDRLSWGDSKRLLINLPPRNGKSKTVSVIWVAWKLGVDPTLNIVCVSYSNELSGKLARDCLAVMQAPWYRELFPGTKISPRRSASYDFETTAGGGRLATSISGSLTGRGGDIIIMDDVIKPEEANSETTRNSVNNWFQSTLASRLNDKKTGKLLCVMQRLHQNDLAGMLMEAAVWDQLSIPAIAMSDEIIPLPRGGVHHRKTGDVLHPEREPIEVLEELKLSMGSHAFQAQYQQDPVPAEGNLFKAEWLKTYSPDFQPNEYGDIVQSWDCAIKTGIKNDYSVCITAVVRQNKVFITDIWRGKVEFSDLKRKAVELALRHSARTMLVEDKASGQQLIQTLRAESHRGVPMPIARTPELDKLSRASGISSMVEAGQVMLPGEAPWLADFEGELLAFPSGRHDDQVDALSQLLDWVRSRMAIAMPVSVGPTLYVADKYGNVTATGDKDWLDLGGDFDEDNVDEDDIDAPWLY